MNKYFNFIILILGVVICLPTFIKSSVSNPTIKIDDDWSVPSYAQITTNSGFFSEVSSPNVNINLPVFDVAWRQVNTAQNTYSYDTIASVKDMDFTSFATQNKTTKPFWMRIWNSGITWAPQYVQTLCNVGSMGTDYDGDQHLPIWDPCVWGEIKKMYTHIFLENNMRADPRLKFIYVPGSFNWCEFDFTEIGNYSTTTGYSYSSFNTWFQGAMQDLVDIFGDYSYKLVYTGEDYPFDVENWPVAKNLLARDAVAKGMGIRNGITEVFNFHLSQIPAYGVTIDTNSGYLNFNKSWVLQSNPNRVIGTENECYDDCGFKVADSNLYYAVKMSNLKSLQMGVNWLYLVETSSFLAKYPDFYNWMRYELGKQPKTSFDAWAILRNAQDLFWLDDDSINWPGKPYIKNLERYLTQRDIKGGAYTKNGSVKKSNIYTAGNTDIGTAYEGRQTDIASGNDTMSFFVDDDFSIGITNDIQIKVTYFDLQASQWIIRFKDGSNNIMDTTSVTVGSSLNYYTATFNFTSITFSNSLTTGRNSDFEIINTGTKDIEILFVRIIKLTPSSNQNTSSSSSHDKPIGGSTNPNPNSSGSEPNEGFKLVSSSIVILLLLILSILL